MEQQKKQYAIIAGGVSLFLILILSFMTSGSSKTAQPNNRAERKVLRAKNIRIITYEHYNSRASSQAFFNYISIIGITYSVAIVMVSCGAAICSNQNLKTYGLHTLADSNFLVRNKKGNSNNQQNIPLIDKMTQDVESLIAWFAFLNRQGGDKTSLKDIEEFPTAKDYDSDDDIKGESSDEYYSSLKAMTAKGKIHSIVENDTICNDLLEELRALLGKSPSSEQEKALNDARKSFYQAKNNRKNIDAQSFEAVKDKYKNLVDNAPNSIETIKDHLRKVRFAADSKVVEIIEELKEDISIAFQPGSDKRENLETHLQNYNPTEKIRNKAKSNNTGNKETDKEIKNKDIKPQNNPLILAFKKQRGRYWINKLQKRKARFVVAALSWTSASWQLLLASLFILVATLQSPALGLTSKALTFRSLYKLGGFACILPILLFIGIPIVKYDVTAQQHGAFNATLSILFWGILIHAAWKARYQRRGKQKRQPVKSSTKKSMTHKEALPVTVFAFSCSAVSILFAEHALGIEKILALKNLLFVFLVSLSIAVWVMNAATSVKKHPMISSSTSFLLFSACSATIFMAGLFMLLTRIGDLSGYRPGYWNLIRLIVLLSPGIATLVWTMNTNKAIRECTIILEGKV